MGRYGKLMQDAADKPAEESPKPETTQQDIKTPSKISNEISPKISSSVAKDEASYADSIRRAVREVGKETSPLRITSSENQRLKTAIRYFEDRGLPTDKTQIVRISLNYILDDYEQHGEDSVLWEILDRIHNY